MSERYSDQASSALSKYQSLSYDIDELTKRLEKGENTFEDLADTLSKYIEAADKRFIHEAKVVSTIKKIRDAKKLLDADDLIARFPTVFDTASQASAFSQRMLELQNPEGAKLAKANEKYGAGAQILKEEGKKKYKKILLSITDPSKFRINTLSDQFGGGSLGALYASNAIRAEGTAAYRDAMESLIDPLGSSRKNLSNRFGGGRLGDRHADEFIRAQAQENYRRDTMSDYDRHMEDLTRRYGGDKHKAEDAYKRELTKNLPLFFKNSKLSSRQLYSISQGLSKGGVIASVVAAPLTAAIKTAEQVIGKADDANTRSVKLENMLNMYGGLSEKAVKSGMLAGLTPEQMLQTKGEIVTRYGDLEGFFKSIAPAIKDATPRERMYYAKTLGVNADVLAWADLFAGTERLDAYTEHRQTQAKVIDEAVNQMFLSRSGSGAWNTIKGLGGGSFAARFRDDIDLVDKNVGIMTMDYVDPGKTNWVTLPAAASNIAESSASTPSQEYKINTRKDDAVGSADVTVNQMFSGGITVMANDQDEFAKGVTDKTFQGGSAGKAVTEALDSKRR